MAKELEYRGALIDQPKPEDWIAGSDKSIPYKVVCLDWTPYLPRPERQYNRYMDTMGCVSFSALNVIETVLNYMLAMGLIPEHLVERHTAEGYIVDGKYEFSDRWVVVLSGTTKKGNYGSAVWDSIRNDGLLPEKDFPFDDNLTWEQYYDKSYVTDEMRAKAKDFCHKEDGDFIVEYERLLLGMTPENIDIINKHRKQAPVQVFTKVCPGWNTDTPVKACDPYPTGHATMIYDVSDYVYDFDHYEPFAKKLALDYGIPFAYKGIIRLNDNKMEKIRLWIEGMYDEFGWDKSQMWTTARQNAINTDPKKEGKDFAKAIRGHITDSAKKTLIQQILDIFKYKK